MHLIILALVPAAAYSVSDKQLVLGTVRWEVTTSTVLVAGTVYPMRVLAVHNSLISLIHLQPVQLLV